jgi:hypothetical protein
VTGGTVSIMDPLAGQRTIPARDWLQNWWDTAGGVRYERWALAVGPPAVTEALRPTSPLHRLLEELGSVPALVPEAALDFFRRLVPSIASEPERLEDGRRVSFTLAVATDGELLARVKDAITQSIATGQVAPPGVRRWGETLTSEKEAREFAALVRTALERASGAEGSAEWCADAALVIHQFFPTSQQWHGTFAGENRFGNADHTVSKVGDWFIDVSADQFGHENVIVRQELEPWRYQDFAKASWSEGGRITTDDERALKIMAELVKMGEAPGDEGRLPSLTGTQAIQSILDQAGVSPANPQYAEMVMRTNTLDAFNQGLHDELQQEKDTFPCWQWTNPDDGRSRETHADRDGNYYPVERSLASIRDAKGYDGYNCRCVPLPVDRWSWEELQAKGARLAV